MEFFKKFIDKGQYKYHEDSTDLQNFTLLMYELRVKIKSYAYDSYYEKFLAAKNKEEKNCEKEEEQSTEGDSDFSEEDFVTSKSSQILKKLKSNGGITKNNFQIMKFLIDRKIVKF